MARILPRLRVSFALVLAVACATRPVETLASDETALQVETRARDELRVSAPDARGPLFLAGTCNGWNPGDPAWRLAPRSGNGEHVWTITLPASVLGDGSFAFKLTRGSWATVEVDEDLRDRPNRVLEAGAPVLDVSVPAWADDRAGSGAPPRASTVVGALEVYELESRALGASRKIRVWTPPQYAEPRFADTRFGVLYLQDGQNLFDAATSFLGVEWRVDETLAHLAGEGEVEPVIVVGIDNAGAERALDYTPAFARTRAGRGRAESYLDFLVDEVMPHVEGRYRVAPGPEHTAIGGSSLGGNLTLYAAIRHPDVFGALLVESPALGYAPPLLQRCREERAWPARVWIGVGTREADDERVRAAYVGHVRELGAALAGAGLGPDRLRVRVAEDAPHHESAWAERLPEALAFRFGRE